MAFCWARSNEALGHPDRVGPVVLPIEGRGTPVGVHSDEAQHPADRAHTIGGQLLGGDDQQALPVHHLEVAIYLHRVAARVEVDRVLQQGPLDR